MKFDLVAFDLDGVLVDTISSWVWVHRHFGLDNDAALARYEAGEIDDWEFMRHDIALWTSRQKGFCLSDLTRILDTVPIMPGAEELVRRLRKAGTKTAIVSGGLEPLAARVARTVGIDRCLANGLEADEDGRLLGDGILKVALNDKATPLLELLEEMGIAPERCAAVGNSYIDIPMFEVTGFGVAFDPHDERVRQAADVVIEEKDLTHAIQYLV